MIEHARLIAHALSTPWALEPTQLRSLMDIATRVALGRAAPETTLHGAAEIKAARNARQIENRSITGGVGVIPIYGVIMQRASAYDDVSGLTSTQQISAALQQAVSDPDIDSILLDVDSPGGSVSGITELAAEIYAAKARKPVIAVANSFAASAAFWIASQASEVLATPSALVGSIGVYMSHEDWSKAMEKAGVQTTLVAAGLYKTEGCEIAPLSAEGRAHIQTLVDSFYGQFTRDVARGRNTSVSMVRTGMGQGRVLSASDAKAAGMIDGIGTFNSAIQRARQLETQARSGARADGLTPQFNAATPRLDARRRDLALIEMEDRRCVAAAREAKLVKAEREVAQWQREDAIAQARASRPGRAR